MTNDSQNDCLVCYVFVTAVPSLFWETSVNPEGGKPSVLVQMLQWRAIEETQAYPREMRNCNSVGNINFVNQHKIHANQRRRYLSASFIACHFCVFCHFLGLFTRFPPMCKHVTFVNTELHMGRGTQTAQFHRFYSESSSASFVRWPFLMVYFCRCLHFTFLHINVNAQQANLGCSK